MKTRLEFERCLFWGVFILSAPLASTYAADIYRCETNGKIAYTAHADGQPDCRLIQLKVTEPNPEDVARLMEEKAREAAEAEEAERQAREDARLNAEVRSARALERGAQAAQRRARIAEEELRLLKEGRGTPSRLPYGGYYPGVQYGGYRSVYPHGRSPRDIPEVPAPSDQSPIRAGGGVIGRNGNRDGMSSSTGR